MSLKSKIQSLITVANAKTGETDTTLTDAIQSLVDGYGGGGSLPSSISKIDGGSFTFPNDTSCHNHYISHNLGVVPKGFVIWTDDIEQYTAGTFRTMRNILNLRRTMLKLDGTVYSLGTEWYSAWHPDGAAFNNSFNYTTQTQVDKEYAIDTIRFYYDSAVYGAGITYKWIAWA